MDAPHYVEIPTLRGAEPWDAPQRSAPRRRPQRPWWASIAIVSVGIVLLSVGATVLLGSIAATVYGARADILYASPEGTPDDARERNLATQRELLRSRAVLADVSNNEAIPLLELQEAVEVEVGRDDLIRLTVADEDPRRALSLAQTIASRYLDRTDSLTSEADRGRTLIQEEIDRLTASEAEPTDATRDRIARLQDRLLDLEVDRITQPRAELISPAYILDKPLSPDPVRSIALGLIIGLLLGTAVAVAMLRRRNTATG